MKKLVLFAAFMAVSFVFFLACSKENLDDVSTGKVELSTASGDVYSENGYLVAQSFEDVDSLKSMLQNRSLDEQLAWDNQFGIKSAKIFRAQASDKLGELDNLADAKSYAMDLLEDGYFDMQDSSLCYPFYNYNWDCVLNKDGIIKIDSILYCFKKDRQIAVVDGRLETLNQYLNNPEDCDTALVKVERFMEPKSTIPTNYGQVYKVRTYSSGGGVRYDMILLFNQVNVPYYLATGQKTTIQRAVEYQLYYHEEKKGMFGWRDSKDIFYLKLKEYQLGGNFDPHEGKSWERYTYSEDTFTKLNSSSLANVYVDIMRWELFYTLSPIPSTYPGTTPAINKFESEGKTDYMQTAVSFIVP